MESEETGPPERQFDVLPGGHPGADHFGGSGRGRFERTANVESEITFRPMDATRAAKAKIEASDGTVASRLMTAGCAEAFLEVRDPAESRHAHLHCKARGAQGTDVIAESGAEQAQGLVLE